MMPYSATTFDADMQVLIPKLPIETALDIGAGQGKWGKLIKAAHPKARVVGVEIERRWVEKFALRALYDRVIVADAYTRIHNPDVAHDLVILGDVLEHMPWHEGMSLLQFFCYRSKWMIALYPRRFLQNTVEGSVTEAHISIWQAGDFSRFDHALKTKRGDSGLKDGVVINGFLRGGRDVDIRKLWE